MSEMSNTNVKSKEDTRILFLNCCLRKKSYTKLLPMGLASVMTYFKKNGYKFDLLDNDINEYEDSYIEDYIKNNQYDFVMLGTLVTHYKWVKWFINMVKKHQPETNVIVGNSVASSIPKLLLEKTRADVSVIGEGEISAYETVDAIRLKKDLSHVQGITFRDRSGEIIQNEPRKVGLIDDFPMPDWEIFDVERYLSIPPNIKDVDESEEVRSMPVITARGCAFECTFCYFVFWNDPYRNRSPKSILAEVKYNIEKYNVNYINFWDDLSFASAKQVSKLCDEILESGLKFKWSCAIRVDIFSRNHLSGEEALNVAKKMKKAGCFACGFSLESGNQKILEMMKKEIDAQAFVDTVSTLKAANVICNSSVVFGYPIETKETIQETFDQCLKAGVYPSIGFLLPLPATGMYDYAKVNGFIKDEEEYLLSITERQDICMNMTKLTDDEIMGQIKIGAKQLNDQLQLGLTEDTYIKTKGYKNYKTAKKKKLPLDPENMKRIENDVSFNYSANEFKVEEVQSS
jgi:radical SAM superfamily enzyme YgiQ (UPF0313 family)